MTALLVPLPKDSHADKFSAHGLDTVCTAYMPGHHFSFSVFSIQTANEDSERATVIPAFAHTEKLTASACQRKVQSCRRIAVDANCEVSRIRTVGPRICNRDVVVRIIERHVLRAGHCRFVRILNYDRSAAVWGQIANLEAYWNT